MLLPHESYAIVIRLLLVADLHEKIILSGNAGNTVAGDWDGWRRR